MPFLILFTAVCFHTNSIVYPFPEGGVSFTLCASSTQTSSFTPTLVIVPLADHSSLFGDYFLKVIFNSEPLKRLNSVSSPYGSTKYAIFLLFNEISHLTDMLL